MRRFTGTRGAGLARLPGFDQSTAVPPIAPELRNGQYVDLVPARLMRARSSSVQRLLSVSDWLARRKSDGRFLACRIADGRRRQWHSLLRADALRHANEIRALARAASRSHATGSANSRTLVEFKPDGFTREFGVDYAASTGLIPVAEPSRLVFAGFDCFERALWLSPQAALAWRRMREAAVRDEVMLHAISGFRSRGYQVGIFQRKQARGQSLAEILAVNAAPGFSEHHGGNALDIGTPGEPPAEESFESTPAFAWL
ncbi:MAG: D-alanyl-D-alanine carboxypeptidase family protein, partial [Lysobacterales bacterium]